MSERIADWLLGVMCGFLIGVLLTDFALAHGWLLP
jgi:hypothetical protein